MPRKKQKKTSIINEQDWNDFTGDYNLVVEEGEIPQVYLPYKIESSEVAKFDSYARRSAAAFKKREIGRSQLASMLELRSIVSISDEVTLRSLNNDIEDKIKSHFVKNQDPNVWQQLMDNMKEVASERFYADVTVKVDTISDRNIFNLLILAHYLGVIYLYDFGEINSHRFNYNSGLKKLRFSIPSVTARDVFNKHIYGDNAKPLLPRVGVFTIDDIERGVRNNMRYAVFSYPGVKDTTQFHDIDAPIFYMSLHDELHRRLMSSIPNSALNAYLAAIDLVREKTGIEWTDDIWNGIDLEIGSFDNLTNEERNSKDPQDITHHFEMLLEAKKYSTDEKFGLFSVESLDTLFILMIDLVNHPEEWKERGIEPQYFSLEYKAKFDFVKNNITEVHQLSMANQVVYLINKYISDDVDPENRQPESNPHLKKCRFKNIHGYVQVIANGKLISQQAKALEIALDNYRIISMRLQITINNQVNLCNEHKAIRELNERALNLKTKIDTIVNDKNNPLSLKQVKHVTALIDMTNLLLTDPSNKVLFKKYNKLVYSQLSIPKKVASAVKGFLSAVRKIIASAEEIKGLSKKEAIAASVRLFRDQYTTGSHKSAVEFRDKAKDAPPSFPVKKEK